MLNYEPDDLLRLSHEVRRFLAKGTQHHRLLGMAKLYLEFPEMRDMHEMHMMLLQAMDTKFLVMNGDGQVDRVIDEYTIEMTFGGISIILTCKQRFMSTGAKPVGYANTVFHHLDMPKR